VNNMELSTHYIETSIEFIRATTPRQ